MRRSLITVLATAALAAVYVPSASAATVVNGGFETGDESGWLKQINGIGVWEAYSTDTIIPPPPQGNFAVFSDQGDPGSYFLYQDVVLEPGMRHVLNLFGYYENTASGFANPATLDINQADPNQQYRIDVVRPTAPLTSVQAGDVLVPILGTRGGDPNSLPPTAFSADLSPFAGQTIRIRLGIAVTENRLLGAADDFRITSTPLPAAPTARCAGRDATLVGTDGNDTLVGTSGKDVIAGLKGKDTLRGRGGNDRLCGKDGKDLLKGGGGNDKLRGGKGPDTMKGGGGDDSCRGGPSQDTKKSC